MPNSVAAAAERREIKLLSLSLTLCRRRDSANKCQVRVQVRNVCLLGPLTWAAGGQETLSPSRLAKVCAQLLRNWPRRNATPFVAHSKVQKCNSSGSPQFAIADRSRRAPLSCNDSRRRRRSSRKQFKSNSLAERRLIAIHRFVRDEGAARAAKLIEGGACGCGRSKFRRRPPSSRAANEAQKQRDAQRQARKAKVWRRPPEPLAGHVARTAKRASTLTDARNLNFNSALRRDEVAGRIESSPSLATWTSRRAIQRRRAPVARRRAQLALGERAQRQRRRFASGRRGGASLAGNNHTSAGHYRFRWAHLQAARTTAPSLLGQNAAVQKLRRNSRSDASQKR